MNLHLADLIERLPELAVCQDDIDKAFNVFRTCYHNSGKLLLCGNGGSAADAEHWSGELLKGFVLPRRLSQQWHDKLPGDLAEKLQDALPAIPLTGFLSASSAFANDVDAEYGFAQLTWALGRQGDVLVAMSTSGNAANVCHAADVAKARQMKVVALTGQGGGRLAEKADVTIRVDHTETYRIQELHLPVYHTLCLMLEDEFFG